MTRGHGPTGSRDKKKKGEKWSHKLDKGKILPQTRSSSRGKTRSSWSHKQTNSHDKRKREMAYSFNRREREGMVAEHREKGRWPKRRTDRLIPDTPRPGNRDGHTMATNKSSNSRQKSYSWFMSYVVSC